MKRRTFITTGTCLLTLPAFASGEPARENPMPEELRKALERDPAAPVLGNPKGNITLTEFFDYNCPFCRKMVKPIHRLILDDPDLRVVFREWPIFGPDSTAASRVSLASLQQGKYWQMHTQLFQILGKASATTALRVADEVGLDIERLKQDMTSKPVEEHITNSFLLAEHVGLSGTPSFIAGDEGSYGELSSKELREMISRARTTLGVG